MRIQSLVDVDVSTQDLSKTYTHGTLELTGRRDDWIELKPDMERKKGALRPGKRAAILRFLIFDIRRVSTSSKLQGFACGGVF